MTVQLIKRKENIDLSFEKEYKVISIEYTLKPDGYYDINYRLLSDKGIPALYKLSSFEILDSSIDSDFIHKSYKNGNYCLAPKVMSNQFFWEDFFNDEEEAIEKFVKRFPEYEGKIF